MHGAYAEKGRTFMSIETTVAEEETATGEESPPTETGADSSQSPKKEIEHPFSKYLPGVDPAEFPKVHPHANLFPMISMEEMQILADSIKKSGQQHPILVVYVTDDYGNDVMHILDGRNRVLVQTLEKAGTPP
jgi:hypothetical protein